MECLQVIRGRGFSEQTLAAVGSAAKQLPLVTRLL